MNCFLVTTSQLLRRYRYVRVVRVALIRVFLSMYVKSRICEMVLQKLFMQTQVLSQQVARQKGYHDTRYVIQN